MLININTNKSLLILSTILLASYSDLQFLDNAYKRESDANVRERILLIRRIMSDDQDIRVVSKELHMSIAWAYKWLRRFDKDGLEGLKNKPRSGRPPDVSQEKLSKIRTELSENPSGWKAKEIMNIIHRRTDVRYHEVHVYRYYTNGVSVLRCQEKDM
jgi:transposase